MGEAPAKRYISTQQAAFIGVGVVEVVTREGERPAYVANGPDRCYHCKDELFTRIDSELAAQPVEAERCDAARQLGKRLADRLG